MIIETDIRVLVVPEWIIEVMGDENGELKHPTSNAILKTTLDPDGERILSMHVLTDPYWEFLDTVTNPEGETKQIREFLGIKKYKYEIEEIN